MSIDAETMQVVRDVIVSLKRIRDLEVLCGPIDPAWREAVRRELRIGGMQHGAYARREGESIADHVQRLFLDDAWVGAADTELRQATGAQISTIRDVRESFAKSKAITRLLSEARYVHSRTGYQGRVSALIHDALKDYERVHHTTEAQQADERSARNARAMDAMSAPAETGAAE